MHSWVCFDCRASYRRQPHISEVACAKCGQLCTYLGTKVPIPRKANEKAWELLRTAHLQRQRNYLADVYRERVAFTHSVAREIARLSALPGTTIVASRTQESSEPPILAEQQVKSGCCISA